MSPTTAAVEAPFLGLRYFDEEHAHLFFGRDEQVNDILERLRRSRLVMVMGGSGSGKSSLVRAGVLPRLKAGFLGELGSRWHIARMRPGSSPIASLARELGKALDTDGLDVTLRRGPLGLVQAVRECRLPPDECVLIVADQFEELFRYQRESQEPDKTKAEAASFVKLLLEAASQRQTPIYVIATMRSDYLGNCAQFRDLPERINDGLYLVPRMRRDHLEQAITGPIAVEDAEISPRLVQKLLNETGDDPDQLPVLQHTLLRTWHSWNHAARPLDVEDLGKGGMQDDLSLHADEIYAALAPDQRRIARVLFQQLCDRDAEGRETRRPTPIALVASVAAATPDAVDQVVAPFAAPDAALLYRNEDGYLDITHESLIRKWTRIQGENGGAAKGWLQEEVEARDQFRLLTERAAKNDPLMGRALDDAIAWRALGVNGEWCRRYTPGHDGGAAFANVLRFIAACEKDDAARRRRRKGLFAGLATALAVVLLVFLGLWQSAARQARAAGVALSQAGTQEAVRLVEGSQPGQALAHFARALRADPDSIAARGGISDLLLNGTGYWPGPRLSHMGRVRAASFSPDGRRVATASDDSTARIWDAGTGEPVGAPLQHAGKVIAVSFSPDGRRVVTASEDSTARIWDAATGQPVGAALQPMGDVKSAVFSPDGRHVLTTCPDHGTAHIWDAVTGQLLVAPLKRDSRLTVAVFSQDGRHVWALFGDDTACAWDAATGQPVCARLQNNGGLQRAAFNPDGRRLVGASSDGTRIWDTATGQPIGDPLPYKAIFNTMAFSPDGARVLTTSHDQTARVWDVATGQAAGAPMKHNDDVVAAAFSPDGSRIVTASTDYTARVWNAATGQPVGGPLQHEGPVSAVTFSPDGQRVVTASEDNTARIWNLASGVPRAVPLQHKADVVTAAFSPDGQRVVTGSNDGTARVWDAATSQQVGAALQHKDSVETAIFSPDGRRVLTASRDFTARVWDAATGQPAGPVLQHTNFVTAAAFSADGRQVVTGSHDGNARVWDAVTGQPLTAIKARDSVVDAAFSPDGRRVITASWSGAVQMWDAVTGQPIGPALEHKERVNTAVFSPDGRRVVTASLDYTAQVWDTATGQRAGPALHHKLQVMAAAFSPDGRRVVTASVDGTAQVWDATIGQPVGAPLRHQSSVNTAVFSPDGRLVLTASNDGTARVWDANSGQPAGAPLPHKGRVTAAAFSPEGRRVVTAASDHTASIWQVLLDLSSTARVQRLADLAEVVGGNRVTESGSVVLLDESERRTRVNRLGGPGGTAFVPLAVLLQPFLDARR